MEFQIPTGWTSTTLENVANWGSGGTPSRKNPDFYIGDIPWIKTGELLSKYIRDSEEKISEEALNKSSAKIFPAGSVGIAMYGATIGKLAIFCVDAATNQACAVATPIDGVIYNEFLYYYLLSERRSLIDSGKGGAQPNISQSLLKMWPILLPPFNEQKRIVAKIEELFSELDNGIAALKTAREKLKLYRQAVLKHAFEGKLTAQWREENKDKLETPEQLLARIQKEREARYQQQLEEWKAAVEKWEENGKEGKKPGKPKKLVQLTPVLETSKKEFPQLPPGWSYIRLGNLIDEPTYGTSAKCDYEAGEQSVLRIPNIYRGRIDDSDLKFASFDIGEIDHLRLKVGDILTIRSNGSIALVGSCALIKETDTKHIFAGYLVRLRPNIKVIKSEYMLSAMSSHFLRKQIESAAKSTSGVNNINSRELQNLIIPLASVEEQEEIISILDYMLPLIDSAELEIEQQLEKSETLRQSILKKAFSGQLVPQNPNDEPASELLARIQAEKAAQQAAAKGKKTAAKRGRKAKVAS
ncbi:MAG: restriction endonuclease [Euryarchaeota archaeon]|nr:restriction endonuclease [Marinobacter sp.]|tara:strand:- start:497 stop:2077 length:1581 start_codon:yes stop_codon:yes gene_type:complete